MKRVVALVCLVACGKNVTGGGLDLEVKYTLLVNDGGCVRVTAVPDPPATSGSDDVDLTSRVRDGNVYFGIKRAADWSADVTLVGMLYNDTCGGTLVDTRTLSARFPSSGVVPKKLTLAELASAAGGGAGGGAGTAGGAAGGTAGGVAGGTAGGAAGGTAGGSAGGAAGACPSARGCVDATHSGYCDGGVIVTDRACPPTSGCLFGYCAPPIAAATCTDSTTCTSNSVCDLYVVLGVLGGFCTPVVPTATNGIVDDCDEVGSDLTCRTGFCAAEGSDQSNTQCLYPCTNSSDCTSGNCGNIHSSTVIEGVAATGKKSCFD